MERKKLKPNIGSHIFDYNKRLRPYLENTDFGTELSFIEKEINKVKRELISQEQLIDEILAGGKTEKIQGNGKEISSLNYNDVWYVHNLEFLEWLEQRKSKLEKPQRAGSKSFAWAGSPEQLKTLYKDLKEARYIDHETTLASFLQVFSDDLTNCKPIKLKASNRLFAYFFNQLFAGKLIDNKEWQRIIEKFQLFQNNKGKYLKAQDLASALSETNAKDLKPRGNENIDEILKNLKTG